MSRQPRRPKARRPAVSALTRFVDTHGWRAYAIPVLSVATVLVIAAPHASSATSPSRDRSRTSATPIRSAAPIRSVTPTPSTTPTPNRPGARPSSIRHADVSRCSGNTRTRFILVSISEQRAWMCAGTSQVRTSAVTTGEVVNGDATPTGSWKIYAKQTDRYLNGPGYHDYVHYWMPFQGDFGFHDASWQTMPFGSPNYRTQGSHGCVHLPTNVMAWLYRWAPIGATVTVTS